jgi:hypothetical protein
MKSKIIKISLLLFIGFITTSYTTECDIVGFYKGVDANRGTKCLTTSDNLEDVETRYCYKYATRDDVVLIVESNFGYSKGKIIF